MKLRAGTCLLILAGLSMCSSGACAAETNGNLSLNLRYFPSQSLFQAQQSNYQAISIEQEFLFDKGDDQFTFTPYLRYEEHDAARRLIDLREALWLHVADNWESRIGVTSVFWGVAESRHLVDIVNQIDQVESFDAEVKLGQPMVNFLFYNDWGDVDVFLLPYFRKRAFSEAAGRPRLSAPVDWENPIYESSKEENHLDVAVRWSRGFGDVELALSHFLGTAREPQYVPVVSAEGLKIVPSYQQIQQSGVEFQYSTGDWLWKFEGIKQSGIGAFVGAVGGFEYNYVGIWGAADLGLIVEYNFDDRGDRATTPYQNDTFFGARLAANNAASSELLVGLLVDNDDQSQILNIEAKTRLTESLQLSVDVFAFSNANPSDLFLFSFRNDDFVQVELTYFY